MIGDGRIRVRKARVTVKDLARDLSLSTSTISRAFYSDAVIAPSTRSAVLTRAAEIGYAPNPLARSLITKRTRIAGVVTSDINNPFYPEVLTRLTERLREIDLNVMLTAAGSSDSLDDAVKLLLSYQPDVVIVLAATLSSEAAEACGEAGTPVLFFNRRPLNVDAFGVTCDNVGGGRRRDHLRPAGHPPGCLLDRADDPSVRPAATQIAVQSLPHLLLRRSRTFAQQADRGHYHA